MKYMFEKSISLANEKYFSSLVKKDLSDWGEDRVRELGLAGSWPLGALILTPNLSK